MKNIVLIGFMATGKSSVAIKLAEKLGYSFLDTDSIIENMAGMTVPEIFSENGEDYFRFLEKKAVVESMKSPKTVIATGGGVVLNKENMDFLKNNGIIIALTANFREIKDRLSKGTPRPLLEGKEDSYIEKLLKERAPYYKSAHIFLDTSGKSIDNVVEQAVSLIKKEDYL